MLDRPIDCGIVPLPPPPATRRKQSIKVASAAWTSTSVSRNLCSLAVWDLATINRTTSASPSSIWDCRKPFPLQINLSFTLPCLPRSRLNAIELPRIRIAPINQYSPASDAASPLFPSHTWCRFRMFDPLPTVVLSRQVRGNARRRDDG